MCLNIKGVSLRTFYFNEETQKRGDDGTIVSL